MSEKSEPTLYQIVDLDLDGPWVPIPDDKMLVPVERCEHGNIDGHWTEYDPLSDRLKNGHWCPGAEIGGDE